MRKFLFIFMLIFCQIFGNNFSKKQQLLQHTLPMANLFENYQKHSNISINDIEIKESSITIKKDGIDYRYAYELIGANFSSINRITDKVNIYTLFNQVYFIEALKFSDSYSVNFLLGNHFLSNGNITSIDLVLDHFVSTNSRVGIAISDYTDYRQSNFLLFYNYKYSKIIDIKAGLGFHYLWKNHDLVDEFDFPGDEKKYTLKSSIYSSFFINPGVEFRSGRFSIRQGIHCRFILLGGNLTGLAYQLKPVIQIGYRIF